MGANHSKTDKNDDHTCPVHSLAENAKKPIFGNTSFYDFNKILGGSCAAVACLVIFFCIFMHASHYSKPSEQSKILKISLLLPTYAIISFLSIVFPSAFVYMSPWLDYVQSISLSSFFLLMCQYVAPTENDRDVFFAALEIKDKKSRTQDGLAWFRHRWIMVFQYPVVSLAVAILTDLTQVAGIYCQWVSKPYFAKLWLTIVLNISLTLAVTSVLKFYMALKTQTKEHRPLAKLASFKAVVGLGFIQRIIFWILTDAHVLNPTDTLTYADLNIGIPNLLTCIEAVPLSLFFLYAYTWKPYLPHNVAYNAQGQPLPYGGKSSPARAVMDMFNPKEIIKAILFSFTMASQRDRYSKSQSLAGNSSDDYSLLEDHYQARGMEYPSR